MHIPTHIFSGWCVGNLFRLAPRERLFCMIAASAADLDGLGILGGQELYWRFHHIIGHNVFFGALMALASAAASRQPLRCFALYLGLFHLHLLMDFYGSGPGWIIHYLWPFSDRGGKTSDAWKLTSWQNTIAAIALLIWTLGIAIRQGRTPVELIAPRLDRTWTKWLADRFGRAANSPK